MPRTTTKIHSWLPFVAGNHRNQHRHTRIKPHIDLSIPHRRRACSRILTYTSSPMRRAPLCTGFILGSKHRWPACAGWNQNTTCTRSRIPSHLDADVRRNTQPGLGKCIATDLRDCLRIVAGIWSPQRFFRRQTTTEQCIEGTTPMITRRNFVKSKYYLCVGSRFTSRIQTKRPNRES